MDALTLIFGGTAAMGTFAVAGAIVAGAKGRHAAGALLGMLLGPFGLIVACLLDPATPSTTPDDTRGPELDSGTKQIPKRAGRGTLGDEMR